MTPDPGGNTGLRFDLDGAVGVAFRDDTTTSARLSAYPQTSSVRSNVVSVSATGAVKDVLDNGTAHIQSFYINNDKLYVVFDNPVELSPGDSASTCVFAVVDANGIPACIDASADHIRWTNGVHDVGAPVQFDAAGAVYYVAYVDHDPVFRRYLDGSTTNLLPPGVVHPNSWAVAQSGQVYATGYTNEIHWLRVIDVNAAPVIQTVRQGDYGTALRQFPDGNIYFWMMAPQDVGYWRVQPGADDFGFEHWVGGEGAVHDVPGFSGNPPHAYYFTPAYGGTGSVFVLHDPGNGKTINELYPQPRNVPTSVSTITHADAAVTDIVLAGFDDTATYKLVLYNLLLDVEIDLLNGRQIEVYSLAFVPSEGFVMFDGLDFDSGDYIFGRVDVATGVLHTLELTTRFTGFQAF